jgi:hypothetical protein
MNFEGTQRISIVGRDEYHDRHVAYTDSLDHVEAIHLGNLDFEEEDIRLERLDLGNGGLAVGSDADYVASASFSSKRCSAFAARRSSSTIKALTVLIHRLLLFHDARPLPMYSQNLASSHGRTITNGAAAIMD